MRVVAQGVGVEVVTGVKDGCHTESRLKVGQLSEGDKVRESKQHPSGNVLDFGIRSCLQ